MRISLVFFLTLFFPFSNVAIGQGGDLTAEQVAWYRETLPLFQETVTGGQYVEAPAGYLGSPFYESPQFDFGEIWLNGIRYGKTQLVYNAWQDDVLVVHPLYGQKVQLKAEKVEKFTFSNGVTFLKVGENPSYSRHSHGFYELVLDGDPKLLRKHFRTIESVREPGLITSELMPGLDYFYWFGGRFWKIGNQNDAMVALGLSKKEVGDRLKQKGITFKHDPERFLRELLAIRGGQSEPFSGFPSR